MTLQRWESFRDLREDGPGPEGSDAKVRRHRLQRAEGRRGPRVGRDPGLQPPDSIREGVEVEGRSQAPLAVAHVKETMVMQVVVDIVDEDRERDAAEELLDVGLSSGTVHAQGVDDLGVRVLLGVGALDAEQGGG